MVTSVVGDHVSAVCQSDMGAYDLGYTRTAAGDAPVRTDRCSHLAALMLLAIRRRSA
jgi:hypothetical protein